MKIKIFIYCDLKLWPFSFYASNSSNFSAIFLWVFNFVQLNKNFGFLSKLIFVCSYQYSSAYATYVSPQVDAPNQLYLQDFIYTREKSLKNDEKWWSNNFSIMSVASFMNFQSSRAVPLMISWVGPFSTFV